MSVISEMPFTVSSVQNNLFSLNLVQKTQEVTIDMRVFLSAVNTRAFPQTLQILSEYYPQVLKTECFNEENLPFSLEVQHTEIGHLFEHLLLSNLYELKVERGYKDVIFNGITKWNWREDAAGTFHIFIDVGKEDEEIFSFALDKSMKLLTLILTSSTCEAAKTKQTAN